MRELLNRSPPRSMDIAEGSDTQIPGLFPCRLPVLSRIVIQCQIHAFNAVGLLPFFCWSF
jgi:hypothetical protein